MSKFQENETVNYKLLLQNFETCRLQQVPLEHAMLGVHSLGAAQSLEPNTFFLLPHCSLSPLLMLGSHHPCSSQPTQLFCTSVCSFHSPSCLCRKTRAPLLKAGCNSICHFILSSTIEVITILIHLFGA